MPFSRLACLNVLATLAALSGLTSCHDTRTQILLHVDTDMSQGPGHTLTQLQIAFTVGDQTTPLTTFTRNIGTGSADLVCLPADLGIAIPNDHAGDVLTLDITAMSGSRALFTRRMVTHFRANQTTPLSVYLANRCITAAACPAGETCGQFSCESEIHDGPDPSTGDEADGCDVNSCPAGQVACGATCVDPSSDSSNCGACGHDCHGTMCVRGTCVAGSCLPQRGDCDNNPANGCESDLTTDPANCGACRSACSTAHATPACVAGACRVGACGPGFADCDANASNGCETDTTGDAMHCGACGAVCSTSNAIPRCTAGACRVAMCTAAYGDCDMDASNGCETDLTVSLADCGACGHACAPSNGAGACAMGVCTLTHCTAGFQDCDGLIANGCEADLASDAANCGGCGHACAATFPHALAGCSMGACAIGPCEPGFGDCDGLASNGCETDLTSSPANCGACHTACALPNAVPQCVAGACSASLCVPGHADCDAMPGDGCEVTLTADPANCGACFNACPARANSTPACNAGACGSTCAPDYAECDGVPDDGCEAHTSADPNNCGACRHVCSLPNATPACAAGACAVGSCNAGHGDCDGVPSNGCESTLASDVNNCGACHNACVVPNATAACVAGACGIGMCNPGYADCTPAPGCESHLTDTTSCGRCGHVCPTGVACLPGGQCANEVVAGLAGGGWTGFAWVASGTGYSWGDNYEGQLGVGSSTGLYTTPTQIATYSDWLSIASSYSTTPAYPLFTSPQFGCGIRRDHQVYCWGSGGNDELGTTSTSGTMAPGAPVTMVSNAQELTVGSQFACALLADASVECWGLGSSGQLGNGATPISSTAVRVLFPTGVTAVHVSAGAGFACAVGSDAQLYCWGSTPGFPMSSRPTVIAGGVWTQVAVGQNHICGLTGAGGVQCFGSNPDGELGAATPSSSSSPVIVRYPGTTPLSGVVQLVAGANDTCAILASGALVCWGKNDTGELGTGSVNGTNGPVAVPGLANVTGVALGYDHVCARLASQQVYCWGSNTRGALGDGTAVPRYSPTRIAIPGVP